MTRAPTKMEACVNLAIRTAFFDHIGQVWPADVGIDLARAAIRAMREPTTEMSVAGCPIEDKSHEPYCFDRSVTDEAWHAMIDAASPQEE